MIHEVARRNGLVLEQGHISASSVIDAYRFFI